MKIPGVISCDTDGNTPLRKCQPETATTTDCLPLETRDSSDARFLLVFVLKEINAYIATGMLFGQLRSKEDRCELAALIVAVVPHPRVW